MEPPAKRKKPANFRLEIPGDDDVRAVINNKMQQVREALMKQFDKPVNNRDIIEHLLDYWCDKAGKQLPGNFTTYQKIDDDKEETLFISTSSSISKLTEIVSNHGKFCSSALMQDKITMVGHVAVVKLACPVHKNHVYKWSSSPHLQDNKFLVNHRILHGFITSGMLPVQYQRFSMSAGIGFMRRKQRRQPRDLMYQCIEEQYQESVDEALFLETGLGEEMEEGITVMSDARHGWRKNAQDTSIVVLGDINHQVLCHEHVT